MNEFANDPWAEFLDLAYGHLRRQQDLAKANFRIGEYDRYDYDQDTASLTFSQDGCPVVVADIQIVGSVSNVTRTWLWAWANDSILSRACSRLTEVKQYGIEMGFERLSTEKWAAEELDGWEMTAAACYVLDAKGAYRSPDERGFLFMVMTDLRWAENSF